MKIQLFAAAALSMFVSLAWAGEPVKDQATVPTGKSRPQVSMPAAGTVAPDFTVMGPDGRPVKLSDYAGKIVAVDFWATWCGPCQQAMPHNNAIYEKYRDAGFVLLGVCASDSRENYDGWVERNRKKYSFPSGYDPAGEKGDDSFVRTVYGVSGYPTMFVIGRDGKIVGTVVGGGPGDDDYRLERLLAKAGAPVDVARLPPEEEKKGPASIPMVGKTPAMPAGGKMIGMGSAGAPGEERFGNFKRGQAVPDFTVVNEKGGETKLSDFKGRTVVVHFFTGTQPQPYLDTLARKYGDRNVAVLAVSTATERKDFDSWIASRKAGAGYPVAWDPVGKAFMESVSYMEFGVGMFPASVVIDASGNMVGGAIGFGGEDEVYAALDKAGVKLDDADKPLPPMNTFGQFKRGDAIPDFTTVGADGHGVRLSDFKGKTVILDFWATWCGPCIKALPHYQDMQTRYKDDGVVMLAVCSFDTRENYDKWMADNRGKYDFVLVFDPAGKAKTQEEYAATISQKVFGTTFLLPATAVIDRQGKLTGGYNGYGDRTPDMLASLLQRAGVKLHEEDRRNRTASAAVARPVQSPGER